MRIFVAIVATILASGCQSLDISCRKSLPAGDWSRIESPEPSFYARFREYSPGADQWHYFYTNDSDLVAMCLERGGHMMRVSRRAGWIVLAGPDGAVTEIDLDADSSAKDAT